MYADIEKRKIRKGLRATENGHATGDDILAGDRKRFRRHRIADIIGLFYTYCQLFCRLITIEQGTNIVIAVRSHPDDAKRQVEL